MKMLYRAGIVLSALSLCAPARAQVVYGRYQTTPPAPTVYNNSVPLQVDSAGNLKVNMAAGAAGAVTIANGSDAALGATTDAASTSGASTLMGYTRAIRDAMYDTTTPSPVNANIATSAPVRIVSAAGSSQDETQVCAAACNIMRVSGYNAAASTRYIKFTNATAANTTPGTTAVYWSIPIPATSPFSIPVEQYFSTAATIYLVTGAADNDTTSVTAADILGLTVTSR